MAVVVRGGLRRCFSKNFYGIFLQYKSMIYSSRDKDEDLVFILYAFILCSRIKNFAHFLCARDISILINTFSGEHGKRESVLSTLALNILVL